MGEEGVSSLKVWETVSKRLIERKKVSRASILMFLQKLRKQGVAHANEDGAIISYHAHRWMHPRIYVMLVRERAKKLALKC